MNKKDKKKKKSGWGWIIFALVIILISGMSEDTAAEDIIAVLVGLAVIIAVIRFVVRIFVKKDASSSEGRRAASAKTDAHGHAAASARRPDPRTKSFSEPDPYCLVCDQTGEDHFARDKALRIAQLDDWLRNGLIDKEEYRALKAKYEKDK